MGFLFGSSPSSAATEMYQSFWQRTISDPVAFFALCTAAFTGVLGLSTIALWRATGRAAKIAERTLGEIERPWLFIEGATVTRRELPGQSLVPNNWFISFRCRNVGRTPAVVEECIIKLCDKAALPQTPDYSGPFGMMSAPRWVSHDKSFETQPMGPEPTTTKNGQPIIFVVYGRVTYKELNGTVHHTGFAVEVSPHMAAFSGYPNDTYDYYD